MTDAFLERRRAAAAAAWNLDGGVVLVAAGDEIAVPGRGDRTYPFRAHSEYLYLTDRERPGGVLAFDPGDGWVEFVAPVSAEALLWTGREGARDGVPEGTRPAGRARCVRARPRGAPAWRVAGAGRRAARRAHPRQAGEGRRRSGTDASRRPGDAGRLRGARATDRARAKRTRAAAGAR